MPNTIRLHRVFKCPPERLYRAFLDPRALVKWNAPHGFVAEMQSIDARVGGGYRMSFINFNTGAAHAFAVKFIELVPNQKIVASDQFDDPNLPGHMVVTTTFTPVSTGTELHIVQEGVPDVIPADMCYLGWQESLELLRLLVEPAVP